MINAGNVILFKNILNPKYRFGVVVEVLEVVDSINKSIANGKIYMVDDLNQTTNADRVYEEDIKEVYGRIDFK